MKIDEAKQQFISSWGGFGSNWGINKTMAQIHAYLLIQTSPKTQDDVLNYLTISRGNVNMNLRDLVDWGLVYRVSIPGERKEFFTAEKDIWKVATQIMKERKKRELEPMLKLLSTFENIDGDKKDKDTKQFLDVVTQIKELGQDANRVVDVISNGKRNWFVSTVMKIFR